MKRVRRGAPGLISGVSFRAQAASSGETPRSAVTADQARSRAKEILGDVAGGANPAEDIRCYRIAPTVASVCERFMGEYVAVRCKPSTAYEYRRSVDLFIKPNFGNRKIADITRPDIAKLHHELRDRPYQANRTLGVLSKLFNLCEIWGLRPDGSNPGRHVRKYPEQKRERFLTTKELSTLGQVLDELEAEGSESPYLIAAFRLLILTGCRLGEIQTLQWSFVMPGYIHLPDSKTGARKIPIGLAVQNMLDALPRML